MIQEGQKNDFTKNKQTKNKSKTKTPENLVYVQI